MAKDNMFGRDDDRRAAFLILSLKILYMPSSEVLRCKECGQLFDTVESLREHMKSEREDIENRVKGFSDG
jgi:hypothetical protein